ncbi:MAG TPA: sugar ABC transporter ATP-binding protein [Tepidisphaeraceae bacterium]|jgi:ribose transport system ATP-binding protein|nr:sugar ABC transporter ATP-binding protein [Tepidisphaeraceae bacterium]
MSESDFILLQMRGITKRFPGVVALQDVHLSLQAGEVLALMGENGAGKSTLMKILGGAHQPDAGEIFIARKPITLHGIADAKRQGIALIHQELMLAPNLDIAGNIFLGNEKNAGSTCAWLDRSGMRKRADALLKRVGLDLPSSTPVSRLTAGQMQMVEIAKALSQNARIIIMDEPTSSLTLGEARQLFKIIADLRKGGIGVVYISHRMEEVLQVADRITVLRDGKWVGDLSAAEATQEKIVAMMVGRPLSAWFPDRMARIAGEVILEVSELVVPGAGAGVSFDVRKGEIFGFAGLVGSGRTELMEVLFGIHAPLAGAMRLTGQSYSPNGARDAIDRGVYLAPEDRKRNGLVLPMSVAQNISLPNIANYGGRAWTLMRAKEKKVAEQEVSRMRIKTDSVTRKVVNLSGGNQQKVVLGKWLAMQPKVLILDEPTRGIDVGAKAEIYRHMAALAQSGIAIIMVSSDMEEVLGMSDRVAVMHERRIERILPREEATQERIAALMTGALR